MPPAGRMGEPLDTKGPSLPELPLDDLPLDSGALLPAASLSYRTYGHLNEDRDNCILLPTYYTGRSADCYDGWIGADGLFDLERWYIVVPDMFGNGRSSSPSNAPALDTMEFDGPGTQVFSVADNVRAQSLLLEHLGVGDIALAAGWSMGAMQALAWAAEQPDRVAAVLAVAGTARCWPGNQAFLAGVESFLAWGEDGLAGFGRAYAGWAYSSEFFRDELWRETGARSLDDVLEAWAADHESWDPRDLRTMLRTWRGAEPGPELERIRARTIYAPSSTDTYFTVPEARREADRIPNGRVEVLDSPWGHMAARPGLRPEVTAALRPLVRELLNEDVRPS
jgi:homoserine O-acetyltransferase